MNSSHEKSYNKFKYAVKKWEKEFKEKYHRTPSKLDIKEAPSKVRYAYKMYYELKTNFLENTLSSELDFYSEELASSKSPDFVNLELDSLTSDKEDISHFPSSAQLSQMLSNIDSTISTDEKKDNDKFSQKLFQHSKFKIRNPRKSQSFSRDKTVVDSTPENDLLIKTSLQNDLGQEKSVAKNVDIPIFENTFVKTLEAKVSKSAIRKVDNKWVSRALCENSREEVLLNTPINIDKSQNKANLPPSYGLSNVVIPLMPSPVKVPLDVVENSDSDAENCNSFDKRVLKPKLKRPKLCLELINPRNRSNKEDKSDQEEDTPPTIENYSDLVSIEELSKIKPRNKNFTENINKKVTSLPKEVSALENKINNGTLNENFVKINVNKKVFVRGKKAFNFSKYKKQNYKNKSLHSEMEFPANGKIVCFKCNNVGHFARYCSSHKGDNLLPEEASEDCDMATLEQMNEEWNSENNEESTIHEPFEESDKSCSSQTFSQSQYTPSLIPPEFLNLLNASKPQIEPIFDLGYECTPTELKDALKLFGHESFRPGQEKAIKRILSGLSTLLILSTGSGKSLVYQLPAYIYSQKCKCITLVISPLVSLMEDQVIGMPEFLKAACLHSNQTKSQSEKIKNLLKSGEINILLISPETLTSSDKNNGFSGIIRHLPPIAFACIDEVHCVSQWSHNFRPSYLMVCKALREKLKVKCILGLTATASKPTITNIIEHIGIHDGDMGVITNPMLPDNLYLSASIEKEKDRALIHLLSSDLFSTANSIIIYCIRRDDCERVAGMLRSLLHEPGQRQMAKNNKRKKLSSTIAEAYHAGMSAAKRKRIQEQFMNGTLKIIVATVAFGMGINKPDIRGIIHYSMPNSFESYVQEIGRAGRDGKLAYCHVFLNRDCQDKDEHLKHIYANSVDRGVIRKLLQKVFVKCNCTEETNAKSSLNKCSGHEVAFPIDETVEELDMPAESIATLLCYLELHEKKYINVLNNCYINCKMFSYGGFKKFEELSKVSLPLSLALREKSDTSNTLEFSVIEIASMIGWESGMTKYHLKNLEWQNDGSGPRKSSIRVEFKTLGFHVRSPGNLPPSELDDILDYIHLTVQTQEKTRLYQLEEIVKTVGKFSFSSVYELCSSDKEKYENESNKLKENICNYFNRTNFISDNIQLEARPLNEPRAIMDIRALISTYKDCKFTGRSIARILQGINSPNYPAVVWGRCKYWRTHINEDFNGLVRIATQQIIDMR